MPLLTAAYTPARIHEWNERLSTVFNRGFWDGYYLGQRLGEWSDVYGSRATRRKIYTGKGNNYFDRIRVAEFLIEAGELHTGDEILITGPTTGVIRTTVREIRVDDKKTDMAVKGDRCSVPVDEVVRRSDKLYRLVPPSMVKLQ